MRVPFTDRVITRLAVRQWVDEYYRELQLHDCHTWTRAEVLESLTSFVMQSKRLPKWQELCWT